MKTKTKNLFFFNLNAIFNLSHCKHTQRTTLSGLFTSHNFTSLISNSPVHLREFLYFTELLQPRFNQRITIAEIPSPLASL